MTELIKINNTIIAGNATRELWLNKLSNGMREKFAEVGSPLPPHRVSIGWTSRGSRSNALAECWTNLASADDHYEIFISPTRHT